MSHEIEANNAFFVQKPAWHGLGQVLPHAPTIEEGIIQAGLDWSVNLVPLYSQEVNNQFASFEGPSYESVSGFYGVQRDSDNSILGVVKERYNPLQNIEAFKFFNPFLESGLVSLESAGSLRDGKRIWVLAKLANTTQDVGKNDPVDAYFLLSNSHDGSLSVQVGFTPVRVVCANTLAMAINGNKNILKVRHTQSMHATLEEIQATVNVTRQQFSQNVELFQQLKDTQLTQAKTEEYVAKVFGKDELTDKLKGDARSPVGNILQLVETGVGTDIPGVRGTLWGAYNAVTEQLSHHGGRNLNNRYDSLWFGNAAKLNQRALTTALQMAA